MREKLTDRCAILGRLLDNTLDASKYVGDVRDRGLFWALEFVKDRRTKEPLSLQFASKLQKAAFGPGVGIYPGSETIDGLKG